MFEQCIQMFEMLYNLLKMRIRFNAKIHTFNFHQTTQVLKFKAGNSVFILFDGIIIHADIFFKD